jgi:hypothetical protein
LILGYKSREAIAPHQISPCLFLRQDSVFVAGVEYRDITFEGLLRQSSFKGLKKKLDAQIGTVAHDKS